jgi:hypothetical protein
MQSGTSHQQVLIYQSKSTTMNYKCDVELGSPRMARLINGKLQFEIFFVMHFVAHNHLFENC